MKLKIINVVGARPNFMKIAPLQRIMDKYKNKIEYKLVHTGQHYDANMSDTFFKDLEIRKPDYFLGCGNGTHGEQTGKIMIEFEKVIFKEKPDIVIVAGDVNSTIACALDAVKQHIKVGHVEAGCRSFDRTMPEEINRMLTDAISDYLFAFDKISQNNLLNEGITKSKISIVGDIMIDSLVFALKKTAMSGFNALKNYGLKKNEFGIITLHRPSNVDSEETLLDIFKTIEFIQKKITMIFPVHPRTMKNIEKSAKAAKLVKTMNNIKFVEPLGYFQFIALLKNAKFALTDSGSIQQEASYLDIPCLTMRENTERPVTINLGTNTLVGNSQKKAVMYFNRIMNGKYKRAKKIELWDGHTSERIVKILLK